MTDHVTYHQTFEAIGTHWSVSLLDHRLQSDHDLVMGRVIDRITRFDADYSRFRSDSLVSAISERAGSYRLPEDAKPMFDLYRQLYAISGGAMTPLIGNLLADAGYDATYTLKPGRLRQVPTWEDSLAYDFPMLQTRQPVTLDLGAIGKGYLIDLVSEIIESHHVSRYIVDAGGDIRQRGLHDSYDRIGLEDPADPGQAVGIASIGDRSLCGSSGNRRSWGQGAAGDGGSLHHIMDPHHRQPVRHIAGLWTVAKDTMTADAMSTALFFVEPKTLLQHFDFEYLILYDGGAEPSGRTTSHSDGFPAELFTA